MKSRRIARAMIVIVINGMFVMLLSMQSRAAMTTLKASYINVGQGDSILLMDGNGFTVLIDGGTTAKDATVAAYMAKEGVSDIDVMVNTHPDADHVGGLVDLLRTPTITVGAVVYNGYAGTSDTWNDFSTQVATRGLEMTPAHFPEEFSWGAMEVMVLNPVENSTYPDTNNASVVLLINHGAVKFLFTGDINSTQEAKVMAHGTPVAAQILKVAHHGASSSSGADFLAAVAPKEAIISVGTNSYGHPGADTLSRLQAAGARIWRTDQFGTITVISNGITYVVDNFIYVIFLPLALK